MKKICCVNDMPGVGKVALSAMIPVLFPMVNILRYDGKLSANRFCCPDVGTINVFQIERLED